MATRPVTRPIRVDPVDGCPASLDNRCRCCQRCQRNRGHCSRQLGSPSPEPISRRHPAPGPPPRATAGLPTSLDGVSVQVNGNPAFVQSVSPTQVVVLTPSDGSTGPVGVVVNKQWRREFLVQCHHGADRASLLMAPDQHYLVTSHGGGALASRLDNFPSATLPAADSRLAWRSHFVLPGQASAQRLLPLLTEFCKPPPPRLAAPSPDGWR